jgi:heavy metal efflux system protein
MIERLIDYALGNRLLVIVIAFLVAGGGVISFNNLPIDAFPDPTPPQVQVFTLVPGFAPEDVEKLVSFPIEAAMNGLPDVEEVRSMSKFGLSVVTIIFDRDTDWYFGRQLVFEQLQQVTGDLPDVAEPGMGPITTGLGRTVQYIVNAPEDMNILEVRALQDWLIGMQLKTVPGINEVISFGGQEKQYQVLIDPNAALKYEVPISDIIDAIQANNVNKGGQFIKLPSEEESLVTGLGWVKSTDDIANIVIKANDGTPVYVRNLAKVQIGPALRRGTVLYIDDAGKNHGEVVTGITMKLVNTNTKEVTNLVKEKIAQLNETLPEGISVTPWYDQMLLIDRALDTVKNALLEGAVLVVLVLLFFLYDWRTSFIVALSIPFSVLIAFIMMGQFNLSANLMSLGGLAIGIGMMVDASVVMVENIFRHLSETKDPPEDSTHIISAAAREVARPVVFAIGIIIIVFIPLITLKGVEGVMFSPMAFTIGFAMLGSLIVALTIAPILCALLLRAGATEKVNPLLIKLKERYLSTLAKAISYRKKVVMAAMLLLIASFSLFPFFGTEFLPTLNEGWLEMRVTHIRSTSLDKSTETAAKISKIVATFPEVQRIINQTGRPAVGMDPEPISNSELVIKVKPRSEWTTAKTYPELISIIDAKVKAAVPEVILNTGRPLANHINELLSGVRAEIAVKIFGDDLDLLLKTANEIEGVMETVPGMEDLGVEQVIGKFQIQIDIDRAAIARFGINVADIQEIVETGIGGSAVSQVFEGVKRFDIYVRYQERFRKDPEAIENLLVVAANGTMIPLKRLANISLVEGPAQISRENAMRRIVIEASVRGRDQGGAVAEAQEKVAQQVKLPQGYFVEWGGQFKLQKEANARFAVVIPITIFLIFLMLYSTFGSLKNASLIILNIPFAMIGGIISLFFSGQNLSVAASVGFIALFGVAILNGVVMVSCFNQLRQQGMRLHEAVIKGSALRLRPILMTASVASLGLVPLLLATGPGSEIQRPLATVVVGGLVSSTLLTLFVLPTVYGWFEKDRVRVEI